MTHTSIRGKKEAKKNLSLYKVQSHEVGALTQWPLLCPQSVVNLNYFMMAGQ